MGNAFAVPVIYRILMALCDCLEAPKASAMGLWVDPTLPTPYYPDVLDDSFPVAMGLALEFSDLTADFDDYMGPDWKYSLIGPDPPAQGRLIRSQRAASLGIQQGTNLSNKTECAI